MVKVIDAYETTIIVREPLYRVRGEFCMTWVGENNETIHMCLNKIEFQTFLNSIKVGEVFDFTGGFIAVKTDFQIDDKQHYGLYVNNGDKTLWVRLSFDTLTKLQQAVEECD